MKNNNLFRSKRVFDTLKQTNPLNNQLNTSFLRHLIDFDFIVNIIDKNVTKLGKGKIQSTNPTDIVDLVAELKIMIRMLQFLSDKQKKKINKFFYFVIESELHIEIFESCLKRLKYSSTRNIFTTKTESF